MTKRWFLFGFIAGATTSYAILGIALEYAASKRIEQWERDRWAFSAFNAKDAGTQF